MGCERPVPFISAMTIVTYRHRPTKPAQAAEIKAPGSSSTRRRAERGGCRRRSRPTRRPTLGSPSSWPGWSGRGLSEATGSYLGLLPVTQP
jgi:hypothetical protein